jgi:ATP-binding cassette, sub-family E, member 1
VQRNRYNGNKKEGSQVVANMPPKKKGVKPGGGGKDDEQLTRIAIVNASKCKPKKCNQDCKKSCPVVKLGKLCIEVTPKSKVAFISEPLCIGKF